MQNALIALAGAACLGLSGLAFYKLSPRDGEQVIPWMKSEGAGITVAMSLITLVMVGIGLLVKAIA